LVDFQRIGALQQLGRSEEARALLDAWQPDNPIDISRWGRMASHVDGANADAHLARAKAAIDLIQDDRERAAQSANLVIATAVVRRHELWPGLAALTIARAELGHFYTPPTPPARNPWRSMQKVGAAYGLFLTLTVLSMIWLIR
jgi:hypothetical protein